MRDKIKRVRCPHCNTRRPSYLYPSHVKGCKLAKEALATIERERLEATLTSLQVRTS